MFAISGFSEAAMVADFPLLTDSILLPNLVFFRSLLVASLVAQRL
jgi:hypothetical protein